MAWCRAARWTGWRWRLRTRWSATSCLQPLSRSARSAPPSPRAAARSASRCQGASRNADIAGRPVAIDTSATLADGETLTLGFARSGSFSYLAIEGGIAGEPDFGSLAVNARAGLGSPYPRPLQSGDELQTKPPAARRNAGSNCRPRPRRRSAWSGDRRTTNSATMPKSCSSTASGRYRRPAIAWVTGSKAPSSSICTATTSSPTAP